MGSNLDALTPEDLFADRYRIVRLLGRGGMGEVYLAHDTMLNSSPIALKVLRADLCEDERYVARFLREVELTRRVTDANVIRTYEVGRTGRHLFFTMEYAEGKTLRQFLDEGPLPPAFLPQIMLQICKGLAAIHDANIVHRDLKPSNLIVTLSGLLKISDFGIARPPASELTAQHEMVGSAPYMAPEIWTGSETSNKADLYSLGILCYELLAGALPFEGETPAEMMCKHLEANPEPLHLVQPDTPLWLSELVQALLRKDPRMRPKNARAIAERIELYLGGDDPGLFSSGEAWCSPAPRMVDSDLLELSSLTEPPPAIDPLLKTAASAGRPLSGPAHSQAVVTAARIAGRLAVGGGVVWLLLGPLQPYLQMLAELGKNRSLSIFLASNLAVPFLAGALVLTLPAFVVAGAVRPLSEAAGVVIRLWASLTIIMTLLTAYHLALIKPSRLDDAKLFIPRASIQRIYESKAGNLTEASLLAPRGRFYTLTHDEGAGVMRSEEKADFESVLLYYVTLIAVWVSAYLALLHVVPGRIPGFGDTLLGLAVFAALVGGELLFEPYLQAILPQRILTLGEGGFQARLVISTIPSCIANWLLLTFLVLRPRNRAA